MNTETDDIKFKALEASVYCPPYKEENPIETINLDDEFDVEKVKGMIKQSVDLLSYSKKYRPLIVEILDILDHNRHEFLLDKQKYITFYWSGILVLLIEINKDVPHNKQLHISLQKYKQEKEERLSEKKTTRLLYIGIGISIILGSLAIGLSLFRRSNFI